MNPNRALEVIDALASGVDPFTGAAFSGDSALQQPDVVRALFIAAAALRSSGGTTATASAKSAPLPKAGATWAPEEDQQLAAAFDAGTAIKDLAQAHQRSAGAIRARLIRLGKLQPGPQPERFRRAAGAGT